MPARRHFGSVRRLPSGRYQASYWHNVTRHVAPDTFPSKSDAQRWLSNIEADINRGAWIDPGGAQMTVAELASRYRAELAMEPGASAVATLRRTAGHHRLVLLTATRDVEHSGAEVLRRVLDAEDD